MTVLTRTLAFRLPMMRGRDVLHLQRQLRALGFSEVGQPDGLFGPATRNAVEAMQRAHNLTVDGIVGPIVSAKLADLMPSDEAQDIAREDPLRTQVLRLMQSHARFPGSCEWRLTASGIAVDNDEPEYTPGAPVTVARVWKEFGYSINRWGKSFGVPVELIVAIICTESAGNPSARREEPGYQTDEATPHRVSTGLMQTLISTARETLKLEGIDTEWLLNADNSIRAGTAYVARQASATLLDPPVVACAYNAGGVYHNDGAENRWKMRQFPIDTAQHADRFVLWFNDCIRVFETPPANTPAVPSNSFCRLIQTATENQQDEAA